MLITLPYPPTGNHAVKHTRSGAHFKTGEAKAYETTVATLFRAAGAPSPLAGPIRVQCSIAPPDRRKRDLDNAWKTAADALTKAGAWDDDSQIADLHLIRLDPVPNGAIVVSAASI